MVHGNIRVLVVDDEAGIRALMREILLGELEGIRCTVFEAPDGQVALDLLEEEEVDIVVTDIKMPNVDGLALLQEVKRRHPATVVVVMTGYTEDYSREEALRLGARDYITKPFEVEEVGLILMKCCLQAEARRKTGS